MDPTDDVEAVLVWTGKSVQAAYFSPNGSGQIVTTCYDDLLRVWSPGAGCTGASKAEMWNEKAHTLATKIKHNNKTGRWVLPFRCVWTPSGDGVVVGAMNRSWEVFDPKQGGLIARHCNAELMTAIPSRNCCHPTLPVVAASTCSGRIHIYRS